MGLQMTPRDSVVTVGATSVEVSPENGSKQRSVLVFTNNSTAGQKITLAWGKDAVMGQGIVLLPGEHHVESIDKGFIPLNVRITAIADAAGGSLAVHERLIEMNTVF